MAFSLSGSCSIMQESSYSEQPNQEVEVDVAGEHCSCSSSEVILIMLWLWLLLLRYQQIVVVNVGCLLSLDTIADLYACDMVAILLYQKKIALSDGVF
jgi:hypothetical protein